MNFGLSIYIVADDGLFLVVSFITDQTLMGKYTRFRNRISEQ